MKETCQAFVPWLLQALQNAGELQDLKQKKWLFNFSLHQNFNINIWKSISQMNVKKWFENFQTKDKKMDTTYPYKPALRMQLQWALS